MKTNDMNQISDRFAISTCHKGVAGQKWKVLDYKTDQIRYYNTRKNALMAIASVINRVA